MAWSIMYLWFSGNRHVGLEFIGNRENRPLVFVLSLQHDSIHTFELVPKPVLTQTICHKLATLVAW
jgi:hypothetical protein